MLQLKSLYQLKLLQAMGALYLLVCKILLKLTEVTEALTSSPL